MDHFETTTDRARMEADMNAARIDGIRHDIGIIDAKLTEMDEMEARPRGIPEDLRPKFDEIRKTLIRCRAGFVLLEEFYRDYPV